MFNNYSCISRIIGAFPRTIGAYLRILGAFRFFYRGICKDIDVFLKDYSGITSIVGVLVRILGTNVPVIHSQSTYNPL